MRVCKAILPCDTEVTRFTLICFPPSISSCRDPAQWVESRENSSKLSKIVQNCPKLSKIVHNSQIGPKVPEQLQNCTVVKLQSRKTVRKLLAKRSKSPKTVAELSQNGPKVLEQSQTVCKTERRTVRKILAKYSQNTRKLRFQM
jgi:hypothetical protein